MSRSCLLREALIFLKEEAPQLGLRILHSGPEGAGDVTFQQVQAHSKRADATSAFVALVGSQVDAHHFITDALEAGAPVIFVQAGRYQATGKEGAVLIEVSDTYLAYALLAAYLEDLPARSLRCVGVTGTNGKTTVTHLLQRILQKAGQQVGLIGTLGALKATGNDSNAYVDTGHTTPMAPALQRHLANMRENGCNTVVMEVSSHALHQHRVATCHFKAAVLTNLTQDHLDYHITMQAYADAKALLFQNLSPNGVAVLNADDPWYSHFQAKVPEGVRLLRYGLNSPDAEVRAEGLHYGIGGFQGCLITPVGNLEVKLPLAGRFSVYNVLAAVATAVGLGVELGTIQEALLGVKGVQGRFEVVHQTPYVVVDYAHTPDGLENVLATAKEVLPQGGRLITLFGCGGDRDATKRPKMAQAAQRYSDVVVVTSDNPRSEDPQQIIADILTGLEDVSPERVKVLPDRGEAIRQALNMARENDVVVLAGKGHETYQILAHETIHFDDKEEALAFFKALPSVAGQG